MNKTLPVAAAFLLLLNSCEPWQALEEALEEALDPDLLPPVLLGVQVTGSRTLRLSFDEDICCSPDSVRVDPELEVRGVEAAGALLSIEVAEQESGTCYTLEATVEDLCGNALSFLVEFFGYNPCVPPLLINEFTTRGTGNHPDLVEIKACGEGDMGGVVLYQGTPGSYDDRLVFPAFAVQAGQFILVHFKPQGLPEEINESDAPGISGGLDACDSAFDFWVPGGTGLSGNNGVISLYSNPGGRIVDGVLYSNRTSDSDELYGGFGTGRTWERAQELVRDGGWRITGAQVCPEDAIDPEGSTGTRSLCRDSRSTDTDSSADWHIVPTMGFSFGGENSEELYVPK